MESALSQVLLDTPDIDSELLDDKATEVVGVLAADNQGLCLLKEGDIDPKLSHLASSLSKTCSKLEPATDEVPAIVLETDSKKLIVKQESNVTVAIMKVKQP